MSVVLTQCLTLRISHKPYWFLSLTMARCTIFLSQSESADRDRWINLTLEASNEVCGSKGCIHYFCSCLWTFFPLFQGVFCDKLQVLKLKSGLSAAYLIQGIAYFLQDNIR